MNRVIGSIGRNGKQLIERHKELINQDNVRNRTKRSIDFSITQFRKQNFIELKQTAQRSTTYRGGRIRTHHGIGHCEIKYYIHTIDRIQ